MLTVQYAKAEPAVRFNAVLAAMGRRAATSTQANSRSAHHRSASFAITRTTALVPGPLVSPKSFNRNGNHI